MVLLMLCLSPNKDAMKDVVNNSYHKWTIQKLSNLIMLTMWCLFYILVNKDSSRKEKVGVKVGF